MGLEDFWEGQKIPLTRPDDKYTNDATRAFTPVINQSTGSDSKNYAAKITANPFFLWLSAIEGKQKSQQEEENEEKVEEEEEEEYFSEKKE